MDSGSREHRINMSEVNRKGPKPGDIYREYYALVSSIDAEMGRILDYLEKSEQ